MSSTTNAIKLDELFECQFTNDELRYLMKKMPKGYMLISTTKSNKILPSKKSKGSDFPNDEIYSVTSTKRAARTKKSRTAGIDYGNPSKNFPKITSESMKRCKQILDKVKKHHLSEAFLEPVDYIALKIPDYPDIIKEPMDLSTVERKLRNGDYATPLQFGRDMRLIWKNALTYNPKGSAFFMLTIEINDYFEKMFREVEENPNGDGYSYISKQSKKMDRKQEELTSKSPNNDDIPLTHVEIRNLSESVQLLSKENLKGVWDIICTMNPEFSKQKELTIDVANLPTKTARRLEKYVKSKLQYSTRQKKKKKQGYGGQNDSDIAPKPYLQPINPIGEKAAATFPSRQQLEDVGGAPTDNMRGRDRAGSSSSSSFFTDSNEDK